MARHITEASSDLILNAATGGGKFILSILAKGKVKKKTGDAFKDYEPQTRVDGEAGGTPPISTARGKQSAIPKTPLEKQAFDDIVANPDLGKRLDLEIGDPRFSPAAGWEKRQYVIKTPDGKNVTVHYQYNTRNGAILDRKITSNTANLPKKQPGASGKE